MRTLQASMKYVMACGKSANFVKNKCMHNRWGGGSFSKRTVAYRSPLRTVTRGCGSKDVKKWRDVPCG